MQRRNLVRSLAATAVAARVVRMTQCKPALTRLGQGRKIVRHATRSARVGISEETPCRFSFAPCGAA